MFTKIMLFVLLGGVLLVLVSGFLGARTEKGEPTGISLEIFLLGMALVITGLLALGLRWVVSG